MDQQRASFGNPPTDQQRGYAEPDSLTAIRIDPGIDASTSTTAWSGAEGADVYATQADPASAAHVLVEQADRRRRSMMCTAPVLEAAAELLGVWCETVTELDPDTRDGDGSEWAQRLAVIALEIVGTRQSQLRPRTPEKAAAVLRRVGERLAARGVIAAASDGQCVVLPRADSTPQWGAYAPPCLAITIDIERGWGLIIDQPSLSPVIDVVGRCDDAGIEAMLDLVLAINTGVYGNIFGPRTGTRS